MFARLVLFTLGPGNRPTAQAMATDLVPAIRARDGCRSVTFFGDDADGQYGLFVLWDSQQSANDAAAIIAPRLQEHLAGKVQGQPLRRLFEVIEPNN